jgi:hypothetical protein
MNSVDRDIRAIEFELLLRKDGKTNFGKKHWIGRMSTEDLERVLEVLTKDHMSAEDFERAMKEFAKKK